MTKSCLVWSGVGKSKKIAKRQASSLMLTKLRDSSPSEGNILDDDDEVGDDGRLTDLYDRLTDLRDCLTDLRDCLTDLRDCLTDPRGRLTVLSGGLTYAWWTSVLVVEVSAY